MRYPRDELRTKARVVMADQTEGGKRALQLVLSISLATNLDPPEVWRRIQELAR